MSSYLSPPVRAHAELEVKRYLRRLGRGSYEHTFAIASYVGKCPIIVEGEVFRKQGVIEVEFDVERVRPKTVAALRAVTDLIAKKLINYALATNPAGSIEAMFSRGYVLVLDVMPMLSRWAKQCPKSASEMLLISDMVATLVFEFCIGILAEDRVEAEIFDLRKACGKLAAA